MNRDKISKRRVDWGTLCILFLVLYILDKLSVFIIIYIHNDLLVPSLQLFQIGGKGHWVFQQVLLELCKNKKYPFYTLAFLSPRCAYNTGIMIDFFLKCKRDLISRRISLCELYNVVIPLSIVKKESMQTFLNWHNMGKQNSISIITFGYN